MRSRHLVAVALVLAALPLAVALAQGPSTSPARRGQASPGKPQAPVEITAELRDGGARVELTFTAAATALDVRVYGTRGLRVTSVEPAAQDREVAAGARQAFEVAWAEAPPGATLAVSVSGRFGATTRGKVVSFTVREPDAAARKAAGVTTDARGRKIRVMPGSVK